VRRKRRRKREEAEKSRRERAEKEKKRRRRGGEGEEEEGKEERKRRADEEEEKRGGGERIVLVLGDCPFVLGDPVVSGRPFRQVSDPYGPCLVSDSVVVLLIPVTSSGACGSNSMQEQQLNRAARSKLTHCDLGAWEVARVSGREITHDEHVELLLQVLAEWRYRVRGRCV
jgi:hypothetical protein